MSPKRITSLDVARKAGVSRTTVSFVLNNVSGMQISDETRKRVLDAARDLGYVPDAAAQALASGRSKTIGLLLVRRPFVIASDMFLTQILEVLIGEVTRQGMRLMLEVVEDFENRDSYLKLVRSNSIDGVLYSGPRQEDEALRVLVRQGIPTVLMGALPESDYCYVDVDNRKSAQKAAAHLISLGHTRIACITNAPRHYAAAADRLQGYQMALEQSGLPFDPELVRWGDFDPDSGYNQMKSLLHSGQKFSSVFIASDVVAFGAIAAIREAGLRVPDDIAVVGFDDVLLSRYLDPSLTTVHLPVIDLAMLASQMLVQLIHGDEPEQRQVLLEATLEIRKSCGAHAAHLTEELKSSKNVREE